MKTKDYIDDETKRIETMKFLESVPPESYPEIAQELWPDMDKDAALSLFLKKLHGVRRAS